MSLDSIQPYAFANLSSGSAISFIWVKFKGLIHPNAFPEVDFDILEFLYCNVTSIELQAIWGSINRFWLHYSSADHIKMNAIFTNDLPRSPYHSNSMCYHANNITKLDAFYFATFTTN